ncbi:dihydroorotase [Cohnella xylanilytica]|uniref:D-aminoacylase n=1 Tax=Cohnella xylanilytica TaxID=557555 RepID=A0A841TZN6_9BACL|nr:D-aminoacylase [Cohnella xylanilytica]MBB6693695.1 D-aminoacylase [Cohnella xylanilytica]GIO15200.1 dihydroorotase [Cohnella xylanilytica]
MKADVRIRGGLIVDGTGAPARKGDIAIKDGRLLLDAEGVEANETVEAGGMVVAPGFIDIHTHSDLTLLVDSRGASKVSQGVTTEIVGNCGMSVVDTHGKHKERIRGASAFIYGDLLDWKWNDYAEYLAEYEKRGISINVGALIGHGTARASVIGYDDRPVTERELEAMRRYVADGMEAGALGLSSGLIYSPGVFAPREELVELCKVVASYGGIYSTHMRNESDGLLDSIEESIQVARESGVSLQISHLKSTGKRNWGRVARAVEMIERARGEGVNVHYDFYPYHASSTGMTYLLPPWAQEGGWEASEARIRDPKLRRRMVGEIVNGSDSWISPSRNAGWDGVMIASVQTERNRHAEGMRLNEYARARGMPEPEAMLDLLLEESGGVGMVLFVMSEDDIAAAASSEWSIVGSDGLALAADGVLSRSKPHPRSYGSFPRVFDRYVRQRPVLTLERAIHKMTGLPAAKLRLTDRGLLKNGYVADVVLFDPDRVRDLATFEAPHQYSEGIHTVWVGGRAAYSRGRFLDPKSGVVVRSAASSRVAKAER